MKIAAITASTIPARSANSMQVMKSCQALSQLGHGLELFAPDTGQDLDLSSTGLKRLYGLEQLFPIWWVKSSRKLRRYDFILRALRDIKSKGFDLIYCWPVQAAVFAKALGKTVVLEMHGPPEGNFGPLLFNLFFRIPGNKRTLFITRSLKTMVERRLRISFKSGEALVVPNGVDLERYRMVPEPAIARKQLRMPDKFSAVYTGHLYAGRGMELLTNLARRLPEVHFLWIGGNPQDVVKWEKWFIESEIHNIDLLGFIPNHDLAAYQFAADVLLMPYERVIEGSSGGNSAEYCSPMKMFEYMASQRPILTSDLPVLHEVLNNNNALFCPPEDLEAWVYGLKKLLNDSELRFRLARQAWEDVQDLSWKKRAEKSLEGLNDK